MSNWKTTSSGVIGAVMAVLAIIVKMLNGEALGSEDMLLIGGLISTGIGLYHARDAKTPETLVSKTTEIKSQ